MAELIGGAIDAWRNADPPPVLRRKAIAAYERYELTRALASVFDATLHPAPALAESA
jgi:hypothetical protein